MSNMQQDGIKTNHIFSLFASESSGFQRVGFRRQNMYDEQERQRLTSYVCAIFMCEFLESMRISDETIFWRHKVDDKGRLSHLCWCGAAQRNYHIFGDVVAFDAKYKMNNYKCP